MSRIGSWGHDLGDSLPEIGVGGYTTFDAGRNKGFSWLDGPKNTQFAAAVGLQGCFPSTSNHYFVRCYVTVLELPPSNRHRLFGQLNFISSVDNVWIVSLRSDGKLVGTYMDGFFTGTDVLSSVTLSVGVTYRLNVEVIYNNNGASTFKLKVDGSLGDGFTVTTAGNGGSFNVYPGFGNTSISIGSYVAPVAEQQGGVIRIDDFVVDNSVEPAAGGITVLKVTGPGTYNSWGGFDWRACVKAPPDTFNAMTNATVDAAQTFTFETMASKGLDSVTIKSIKLCINGQMSRNGWKYRLRKNGVDSDSAAGNIMGSVNWFQPLSSFDNGLAWGQTTVTFPLLPGDTIEGGLVDGPAGAGTSQIFGVYLIVEWEGTDPVVATPGTGITTKAGTYAGNGTSQDIAFADPLFVPDAMIVIGDSAAGFRTRGLWFRGMGEDGQNGCTFTGSVKGCVHRTYTGGFTVVGSVGDSLNAVGTTYRYLAVSDPSKRMMSSFLAQRNGDSQKSVLDNIDIPLTDLTFGIQVLLSILGEYTPIIVSDIVGYTDTTYAADRTTMLDRNTAAPIADAIQSIGTGTFQVGAKILSNSNPNSGFAAFRTTQFVSNRLMAYGTYTGNGAGSRVVPLAIDGPGAVVFVFSEDATEPRYYRFYNDGLGASSRQLQSGTANALAITAFSTPGQMTVNATVNTAAITYHYWVFAVGTDVLAGLSIIVPQPTPSVDLCDDCGCRMVYVPREVRSARIQRDVRTEVVPLDPRTEVVLLDARKATVTPENRILDIECA